MTPMDNKAVLPADVIEAIRAGRKIDAIKLLREAQDLGLKESKQAVDAYLRSNPSLRQPQSGTNGFLIIVVILFLGYVGYQLFK